MIVFAFVVVITEFITPNWSITIVVENEQDSEGYILAVCRVQGSVSCSAEWKTHFTGDFFRKLRGEE